MLIVKKPPDMVKIVLVHLREEDEEVGPPSLPSFLNVITFYPSVR